MRRLAGCGGLPGCTRGKGRSPEDTGAGLLRERRATVFTRRRFFLFHRLHSSVFGWSLQPQVKVANGQPPRQLHRLLGPIQLPSLELIEAHGSRLVVAAWPVTWGRSDEWVSG